MSEFIIRIKPQLDFPEQDITDDNAALLELMIGSRSLVLAGHVESEKVVRAFRYMHPAVVQGANRVYDTGTRLEAIDHGVAAFEAICLFLGAHMKADSAVAARNSIMFAQAFSDSQAGDYLVSSLTTFREELPRTSEVILSSSRRFFGYYTEYALMGAALTRQIELVSSDVSDNNAL